MATIKDVAQRAGVSTATVSRALTGSSPVSDEVRDRVQQVVAELDYRPNGLARSLRTESTGTVGLVVSTILNPFFTHLARAAEDEAIANGFNVILCNADDDASKEERYLQVLLEKRVDGLLLNPSTSRAPHIQRIASRGVPIVLLDRSVEGVDAPIVRSQSSDAIAELVRHMVSLGHKRLGMISGPLTLLNGAERYRDFTNAARAAGHPVDERDVVFGDFERTSGAEGMRRLLSADTGPDAVFVANGPMALGALEALLDAGLSVPDDISIAAFDDDPWFRLVATPVTAIRQPTAELGRLAMRTLLAQIHRTSLPQGPRPVARLITRASCGEAPSHFPSH